ncbi:MAG: hypothetical protein Q4Q07_08055 [Tissierellia bacterium]|nr:hypothetical protein [Tissierellia bacterium]
MRYISLQLKDGCEPMASAFPLLHELTVISDTLVVHIPKGHKEGQVLREQGFTRHELKEKPNLIEYRENIKDRGDHILQYIRRREGFPWHSIFYRRKKKDLLSIYNYGVELLLGPFSEKDMERYLSLIGNNYTIRLIEEEELNKVKEDMSALQCANEFNKEEAPAIRQRIKKRLKKQEET